MNKEEAIDKLNKKYDDFLSSPQPDGPFLDGYISALITAKDIINQINEDKPLEGPMGVLMIYVDYGAGYNYLATDKANDSYKIGAADTWLEVVSDSKALKVTEAEAKEKYPNFKWVSLEELENED